MTGNARVKLPAAAVAMEKHLDGKHLVELGVGCEACHNGARVHSAEPTVLPELEQRTPLFAVEPPKGQSGTRAQIQLSMQEQKDETFAQL